VELALVVRLSRGRHGHDVEGRTEDVGPSGIRVATRRPLRPGEPLSFVLTLDDGTTVTGQAHVVREHACDVYALRFDRVAGDGQGCLEALVAARQG